MENNKEYQVSKKLGSNQRNPDLTLNVPQQENADFEYGFRQFEKPSMAYFGFDAEKDKEFPYFTNTQAFEKNFKEEEEIQYFSEPKIEFDNHLHFLEMETASPHSKSLDNKPFFAYERILSEPDNSFAFRSEYDEEFMKNRKAPSVVVKQDQNEREFPASSLITPIVEVPSPEVADKVNSSSGTPRSVDPEKLSKLFKCLKKTKGIDHDMITEDLIERTMELGQQRIAEQLQIPYRRYKSILNKVGIKTIAGRKVQNQKLESVLVEWALQVKSTGKMLTRKMVQTQAAVFQKDLINQGEKSLEKVRLSKGWLDKFLKRHEEIKCYLTSQKGKKSI